MAPPVGLLIGHSFVHGLASHLSSDPQPTGSYLARKLNLNRIIQELHMHGERGSRVCSSSFSLPHRLLKRVKPDFVILDLGTNDLAAGAHPFDVAAKLNSVADRLHTQYHVRTVLICSILYRKSHLRNLTREQFTQAAFDTNNFLKKSTEASPRTIYHVHKGFWTTPISQWSRDGVHPNTSHGRTNYKKSIRCAVFSALQTFTSR